MVTPAPSRRDRIAALEAQLAAERSALARELGAVTGPLRTVLGILAQGGTWSIREASVAMGPVRGRRRPSLDRARAYIPELVARGLVERAGTVGRIVQYQITAAGMAALVAPEAPSDTHMIGTHDE